VCNASYAEVVVTLSAAYVHSGEVRGRTRVCAGDIFRSMNGSVSETQPWKHAQYSTAVLIRTPTGWQVLGRGEGGADGREVTHYFDREDDARRMVQRMLDAVPEPWGNWALMPQPRRDKMKRPSPVRFCGRRR
jgi:hypothetical protein